VTKLIRLAGEDDAFMLLEASDHEIGRIVGLSDVELVSEEPGIGRATVKLEDSLGSVRGAAIALLSSVAKMPSGSGNVELAEASLEVGVKMGIEGGVIVAKGSMEADASVKLVWRSTKAAE